MTMRNVYQPARNSHENFQKFDEMAEKRDETAAGPENGGSHGDTKARRKARCGLPNDA
jgi:hypothetical protein